MTDGAKFGLEGTTDEQLRRFRDELYDEYGIYFPEKKFYQLRAKLGKRLRRLDLESLEEYRQYLRESSGEISKFLDVISTNTTRFYREPRHWDFMREELFERWRNRSKILGWSAACSSGEEPYTLAALCEQARSRDHSFDYRVLATDLSEGVLRRGKRGLYSARALEPLKDLDPGVVPEFFTRGDRGKFRVEQRLRDRVVFRQFNLKTPSYPYEDKFDLILLRNVIIYFDQKMTEHVIENLAAALRPGGHLFVGHSESLSRLNHSLEKVRPAIYRRT